MSENLSHSLVARRSPLKQAIRIVLMGSAAASLALPVTALAQEQNNEVEEIVVLGQKSARDLQDTTASVRVITTEEITQQNINGMYDVLQRTANVSGELGGSIKIRGIDAFTVSGGGNSYLASVYSDGAVLPYRAIQEGGFSSWDVQQVEVLRGPQSTLQGRNALAGAIVMNTVDPTYEWDFRGRLGFGEDGREEKAVAFGGPLIADQLAFRVAAEDRQFDGINDNVTRGDHGDFEDDQTLRVKLLAEPDALPDLRALLTLTKGETDYGVKWIQTGQENPFETRHVVFNDPTHEFTESDMAVLKLEYGLGANWDLTATTAYSDIYYGYEWDGDTTPAPTSVLIDDRVDETISQEVLFNFDYGDFTGVIGGFYSDLDVEDVSTGQRSMTMQSLGVPTLLVAPPEFGGLGLPQQLADMVLGLYADFDPAVLDTDFNRNQRISSEALFVDFNYRLNEKLEVYGGLRYDHETQENEAENRVSIANASDMPDPTNPAFDPMLAAIIAGLNGQFHAQAANATGVEPFVEADFSTVLPKGGLTWHWNDDVSTSFTVQKGYRSGGVGSNIARASTFTYDPEYTWNYEASLRSQWLDNRLTANANLFYLDWEDQQVSVQLSGNEFDTETLNSGSSEVKGVEFELFYQGDSNWRTQAGIGYSETEFKEFDVVLSGTTYDLSGREFQGAPNWTGNLAATYQGDSGIRFNINANYVDDSAAVVNPFVMGVDASDPRFDARNDSRVVVNTRFGYQSNGMGIFFIVNNLLDEEYVQSADTGSYSMTLGMPRLTSVRFEASF